jgi:DNA-binding NarL/FixJ family response regulator
MIRAFVAAPAAAARARLRARLEGSGVTVVGAGAALEDAPPDVDVVIVTDPGRVLVGPEALAERSAPAVVAVTDDTAGAIRTLRGWPLRGWAIVGRDASAADLRAATAVAARGFTALPAGVAAPLLRAGDPRPAPPPEDPGDALTPREREVLDLLAHGLSNRRIADALGISEHTAKFHVAAVCGKLGAASRTEAVSRGIRRGLVTL